MDTKMPLNITPSNGVIVMSKRDGKGRGKQKTRRPSRLLPSTAVAVKLDGYRAKAR